VGAGGVRDRDGHTHTDNVSTQILKNTDTDKYTQADKAGKHVRGKEERKAHLVAAAEEVGHALKLPVGVAGVGALYTCMWAVGCVYDEA
jgi:hypothetical protein